MNSSSAHTPRRRWTEASPHGLLEERIRSQEPRYREHLRDFLDWKEALSRIALQAQEGIDPCWGNEFFSGLDAISLYSFMARRKPRQYLEIGSGHSTRFACRAIEDHQLETAIISIDPEPRGAIDALCARAERTRLEDLPWQPFVQDLKAGDMVLFDGTHRAFQNSDATVFFTELFPAIPSGVLIGIHDICLPADYPARWERRFYSEQYLLACWLLADTGYSIQIELPLWWVSKFPQAEGLRRLLAPLWQELPGVEQGGCCFWVQKR